MYRKDSIAIGEWIKNSNKALLVTGARQIGKTWLIRDEIEKSGYTKFEVNFIDQPDMVSYLNAEMSAEDFLIKLKMIMPEDCKSHETVVFFDEIQKCPEKMCIRDRFCHCRKNQNGKWNFLVTVFPVEKFRRLWHMLESRILSMMGNIRTAGIPMRG